MYLNNNFELKKFTQDTKLEIGVSVSLLANYGASNLYIVLHCIVLNNLRLLLVT